MVDAPTPGVHKSTLENGIRVVTDYFPGVRSTALCCLVGAGPQDETPRQHGLAHFVEHLMFQGTTSRDAGAIADLMDTTGGNVGAFTARDYTCYYANLLDEYRTYGVELLSDVLLNSVYPPERLASERDAIVNEINTGYDIPGRLCNSLLKETAWMGHPLGRSIAGTAATVGELDREDVIYYVHENYQPDRVIVAAAGSIEHADFCALVRDGFWRMLGESPTRKVEQAVFHAGVVCQPAPLHQAYFSVGIPAYNYMHEDRYALHVLNTLLGGGMSSRLFRRVRKERGLVYDISSDYEAYQAGGMLVVEGCTVPEYLEEVMRVVLNELGSLASAQPVDDEELRRAKMQIRAQHLLSGESMSTRMSRLATQEFYFGKHAPAEEVVSQIENTDHGTFDRLAKELLSDSMKKVAISVVGPESEHYSRESLEKLVEEYSG